MPEDRELYLDGHVALLIGDTPGRVFTFIKEKFRGRSARMVPESERHPLTRLEGIDLYDRARLEQEGKCTMI